MLINGASLHLLLNHLPVLLPLVGVCVLTAGTFFKLRQTQNVGLVLLVFGALSAAPTYWSGSPAQSVVQNYPLAEQSAIQTHAGAALYAVFAIEIVGFLAAAILWQSRRGQDITRGMFSTLITLSLISFFLMARTAHLGGLIRHEEIEQGAFHQITNR